MAGPTIRVLITGDEKGFSASADKAEAKAKSLGDRLKGGLSSGYVAVAAAAAAAGAFIIDQGMKLQESQDKLGQALKNAHTSWSANATAIDAAVKANERYGTSAAETEHLLTQGVTSTGSLAKAIQLLALSQNIAAATGKPLADVYLAVTKASEGQLRPLKMLGIDLPIAAGGALKVKAAQDALAKALQAAALVQEKVHTGHLKGVAALQAVEAADNKVKAAQEKLNTEQRAGSDIITVLSKKYKGQADVAAESLHGKLKALETKLKDLAAQIGVKLIPILTKWVDYTDKKIVPSIENATNWLSKHKGVMTALAISAGILAVSLGGPVVQFMALGTAAVWAYNKFGPVRSAVDNTAFAIRVLAQDIQNFPVNWVALMHRIAQPFIDGVNTAIDLYNHIPFVDHVAHVGWANTYGAPPAPPKPGFGNIYGPPAINKPGYGNLYGPPALRSHGGGGVIDYVPLGAAVPAIVHGGETVLTPAQLFKLLNGGGGMSGRGGHIINNFPAGVNPTDVVRAQKQWNRRNGVSA